MNRNSSPPGYDAFVRDAEPRLRKGYIGVVGIDRMPDAVGEALAYAWENWDRVASLDNPVGYIFRVGQSKIRTKRQPRLFERPRELPDIEPGLPSALLKLPRQQRAAVWLVHGCRWSHGEVAEVLDISPSTVSTHVNRALIRLRTELGVPSDA